MEINHSQVCRIIWLIQIMVKSIHLLRLSNKISWNLSHQWSHVRRSKIITQMIREGFLIELYWAFKMLHFRWTFAVGWSRTSVLKEIFERPEMGAWYFILLFWMSFGYVPQFYSMDYFSMSECFLGHLSQILTTRLLLTLLLTFR